jgi:prephenate dehydratase
MKVAFQGERGANSEEATLLMLGDQVEPVSCDSFSVVFDKVQSGEVDAGVIPIENSFAGPVHENYDLLFYRPLYITAELDLRIRHCLMALPGETLATVQKVISHPQALAQCAAFLERHKFRPVPEYDTAGSAKKVSEEKLKHTAAIASKTAARLYGLELLAEGIETSDKNYTKFLTISRAPAPRSEPSKTAVAFVVSNAAGALYHALGPFARRGLNITKLECRPRRQEPWEYIFYLDFEGHASDREPAAALAELGEIAEVSRVLGSFSPRK